MYIENNKDYNVSSLFDNFEISSNSTIDKIISYDFPEDFDTFLKDTIKTVRKHEIDTEKEKLKNLMNNAGTIDERFFYLSKIQELDKLSNKE